MDSVKPSAIATQTSFLKTSPQIEAWEYWIELGSCFGAHSSAAKGRLEHLISQKNITEYLLWFVMLYFLFFLVLCFVCYCMPFLWCWWIRLQTGQGRLRLYHQTWRQAPAPFMLRLDLRDFQITDAKYPNVKVHQLCRHVQVLPHHHTAGTSTCLHIWYVSRLQEHWQESLMDPRPNPHYSPETSVKAIFVNAFIHFCLFSWCCSDPEQSC